MSRQRRVRPAIALAVLALIAVIAHAVQQPADRRARAQRPTSTRPATATPAPPATPEPEPTPADPSAPPAGAGARERAARQVFVPLLGDYETSGENCAVVVAVFNAGDEASKPVLVTWDKASDGDPLTVLCGGLVRPGASWRFDDVRHTASGSGVVFSLSMRSLTEVAPELGFDDLVGDYLCEHLFFDVVGDGDDYVRFRRALDDGGPVAGLPLDRAAGGPVAVSVERTCRMSGTGYSGAAEYGGTTYDASLAGWSPTLSRYRYALPALHGTDTGAEGRRSRIFVQNAGTAFARAEILLAGDGAECEPPRAFEAFDLPPGATHASSATLPAGATAGWVLGTQPLAVVVETRDTETITAYEGGPAPDREPAADPASAAATGTLLHAPLAYAGVSGWTTAVHIENLDAGAAARVHLGAMTAGGNVLATEIVWICPSGHVTVDVGAALDLAPGQRYVLRIESLPWQTAVDPGPPPADIAAVVEVTRRLPGAAHDSEAGAYRITGVQRDRFDDGPSVVVVPDVASPQGTEKTIADLALMNVVSLPGRTSSVVGFGGKAGLDDRMRCQQLNERSVTYLALDGRPADDPPFRGAALVSAAAWDHWAFGANKVTRNVVGLGLAAIERPAGSMPWDDLPDGDAPGDATRLQGGIPIPPVTAGGPLVRRSTDGRPLRDVCPADPRTPTSPASPSATPTAARPTDASPRISRLSLPLIFRSIERPPLVWPVPCDAPWRLHLTVAADGGSDVATGIAPCNGRTDRPDIVAALACPLPALSVRIARSGDGSPLWQGALTPDVAGAVASVDILLCAPPPYTVTLSAEEGRSACWRACPGSPEVRALTQADFDAAAPGGATGAGRAAALGWSFDRTATVAASQGPPLVYVPVLNFFGEEDTCITIVSVQNVGAEVAKAALVTWGEPGRCPPAAAGPLKVECSGLIQPGSGWSFAGAQIPTGSKSGYVVSFTAKTLSEIGVDLGFDDVVGDVLCENLFFNVVGDGDDERRFRHAFVGGDVFAGIPLNRAYGGALAVHVERACPTDASAGAPVAVDAYLAPGHRTVDARPEDVAEYRYPLPALVAADTTNTIVHLQNAGLTCNDVELVYRSATGSARCATFPLAPGEARSVDLGACLSGLGPGAGLASPGVGWAIGTSALAVVVDVADRGAGTLASYVAPPSAAAIASPGVPLAAPLVLWSLPATPRRARLFVQNVDPVRSAHVEVVRHDRDGATTLSPSPGGLVLDPAAGGSLDVPAGPFESQLRVTSTCPPTALCPTVAPIAAALLQWRQADDDAPARDAVMDVLAPIGQPEGLLRGTPVGVTRLAIPAIGRAAGAELPESVGKRSSWMALANRVDKPGFTDLVVYFYDQNGLLDYMCQKLNERETDVVDMATMGFVNNGFRGSALVSAWFWEHDVFDTQGQWVRNLVDLDAAFGWPGGSIADDASLTAALPLAPDVVSPPTVVPLCGSAPDTRPPAPARPPRAPRHAVPPPQ